MMSWLYLFLIIDLFRIKFGEEINLQINVPEFICDQDGEVKEVNQDRTRIMMFGDDVDNIEYKFKVDYKWLGQKCKNQQRCTLMLWKMIRNFQDFLNNYQIKNGVIEFENEMLMQGLMYYLDISFIKDGRIVDSNRYTLEFVDEEIKNSVQKPLASLALLGSNIIYAHMSYYITAEVIICSDVKKYYYNWTLLDHEVNFLETYLSQKSLLEIKPNNLKALTTYFIKCDLINYDNNEQMASSSMQLKVLKAGILVKLPFDFLLTKSNEPIKIESYIVNLDNTEEDILFTWSCESDLDECLNNTNDPQVNIEQGLPEGKYTITLEISYQNQTETHSCVIQTKDDISIIEFDTIKTPTSSMEEINIYAKIYARSFCMVQWSSVEEEGFEYLDLALVPGGVGDSSNITTQEEKILQENQEFSEETLEKDVSLYFPPPNESWEGLQGDRKYKFRVNVSCPNELVEVNNSLIEYEPTNFKTAYMDVSIETNAPPEIGDLEIKPLSGVALMTQFNFQTERAFDIQQEKPITYRFGYTLNPHEVFSCIYLDITSCRMILPYSENGVQTLLVVCDSLNSCARKLGPIVQTQLPQRLPTTLIYNQFMAYLYNQDYYNAFLYKMITLKTVELMDEEVLLNSINQYFEAELTNIIDNLLDTEDINVQWKYATDLLLEQFVEFHKDLTISEDILEKLSLLRNKTQFGLSNVEDASTSTQRKLLSEKVQASDINAAITSLKLSETIILTSKDSKKVFTEIAYFKSQVKSIMEQSCTNLYGNTQNFRISDMTIVIFEVEKMALNLKNKLYIIPYDRNKWNLIAQFRPSPEFFSNLNKNEQYCVGKAMFNISIEMVTMIHIINAQTKKSINLNNNNFTVVLPKKDQKNESICVQEKDEGTTKCHLFKYWPKYVSCICSSTGIYRLTSITSDINPTIFTTIKPAVSTSPVTTEETLFNNSSSTLVLSNGNNYELISYVVTVASVFGIALLCIIGKRIWKKDDDDSSGEDDYLDDLNFPKYAQLYDEEVLENEYI